MEKKEFSLSSYHVSHRTGCLIEEPLFTLPSYFDAWNYLSVNVCDLIKAKQLRDEVHKLPLLDHTKLQGYRQCRLAHLQLAFITAGYVWQDGDKGAVKVLPQSVAVPFYHISKKLGVLPVMSHMDLVLSNFMLQDINRPWDLTNIDCFYSLPGGEQGKWLMTVSMLTELEFAKCLKSLETTVNLTKKATSEKEETLHYFYLQDVIKHLQFICVCIYDMKKAVARMHDNLPASTFYNIIRPFLEGWGGEGNILPEGLIYEGISKEPMQFPAGSGAQSTSLQTLDALFGIQHAGEKKEFLLKMRKSMPPDHVRLIEDLEKCSNLPAYVIKMDFPALTQVYNQCIEAIIDFRRYHIGIIHKYVLAPAKNNNEGNCKSLDKKGTSGTDLIAFLKGLIFTTQNKELKKMKSSSTLYGSEKNGIDNSSVRNVTFLLGIAISGLLVFAARRLNTEP